jgi:hypothetical protein
MTLQLATQGYLRDDCPNDLVPPYGTGNFDPPPKAPSGRATLSNPIPLPPVGSAVASPLNPIPRPPTGTATLENPAPIAPRGTAVDETPNPPPKAPGGGKAEDV